MPAITRDQVVNLFKDLQDILNKFLILIIALIAATNTADSGKILFMEQHKVIKPWLLIIVLYSFFSIIGTIQIYNGTFLPIIICAMLGVGAAASFLALTFVSTTVALITLAMWLGMFILVAYDYGVPQRIKIWIENLITWCQGCCIPL